MKVLLASTSKIKRRALELTLERLAIDAQLTAIKAQSDVPEQPIGEEETLQGAINRANNANSISPGADLVISIESGIFSQLEKYFDCAIVLALQPSSGKTLYVKSDRVEFPSDAVLETIRRGCDRLTCGQVLVERGEVETHDDPHLSLTGKPRVTFLTDAVINLFRQLQMTW